jgi:eukaryotic-like serine/threonine-protein kinase
MAKVMFEAWLSSSGGVWVAVLGCTLLTACSGTQGPQAGSKASQPADVAGSCPSGMVMIPAGTYEMGSDSGKADEKPPHQVTVAAFCIDRTEVTVAAYAACVGEAKCSPAPTTADWPGIEEDAKAFDSQFCNGAREDHQRHPINCVDWHQADAYCRAVGKRLPTEEEWEYTARGQDGRKYPWGNAAPNPELLNTCDAECVAMGERFGRPGWKPMFSGSDGWETTSPVGSYPKGASPFGVLDMAGNVWEMTSSRYSLDYRGQRTGEKRVYRGGAWGFGDASLVRTTYRGGGVPTYRGADLGLRCAQTLLGSRRIPTQ